MGAAYRVITTLCERSEFYWSDMVRCAVEGYAKAAVRADVYSMKRMYGGDYSLENHYMKNGTISIAPPPEACRLWWAIRAAEKGDLEAVDVIYKCSQKLMDKLSRFRQYQEADKLYREYEELQKYWKEKEVHMRYPDQDCYEAYVAEKNKEFEKALDLYRRAAERNNQQAIEAVRRLTGNKKFMLKTGCLKGKDYKVEYEQAIEALNNGTFDYCVMQARKTLEMYIHNLFFEKQEDMPENDKLNNLIKELQRMQLVDEETYNAMDFVRRKANPVIHGEVKTDKETANRVMNALTQIIENE